MALLLTSLRNSWMFINKPIIYSLHPTTNCSNNCRQTCLISFLSLFVSVLSLFVSVLSVFVSVLSVFVAWKGYLHWTFALFCIVASKSVLFLIFCVLAFVVWLANLLVDWLTYWLIGILLYRQEWFVCFLHVFSTTCAMLLLVLFCGCSCCCLTFNVLCGHVTSRGCVCCVVFYFKWCCVAISSSGVV